MELSQDLSFIELIRHASWVVKLVLLLLLGASFMSWWTIFDKLFALRKERCEAELFEREFWSGGFQEIVKRVSSIHRGCGMEEVFRAGYRELSKLKRQPGVAPDSMVESVRRAMRATYQREMDILEAKLPFLATVGSVSPYVGLFGTVWGIMNAFRGLSNVAQTTLAQVAPGIAEALIATAIGLFAAIPAVIAYNNFTHELDRLANRYDVFMEEFSNLLQREAYKS
ncbi:MAG: protein TolQ [Hydrogenophilales bacterium CG03_land_8_20_14_0_80_62_28]|nr:protein TolQ [Betaproteobacteria bacterium]OIO77110.1 MAG: protein TolQ [Hydrogenophilaceae bacterium CG1_02_62_390]PIV24584.1 MAG: protein TolQ [Hydrogenophilales bacterium CG03_land_8_20_14_0_80_62_28]PIW37505.1 MAG: protein TolQ [Hydrogenophilales bacterium CG15_BIG_FIL_POST_REV_8_21_14_020_62_31]PIW72569.1 MAG: protein TolQ [Hydrogenophilales bacterium CG12_big_fil_rev_8_21_14_0_65_61_21]PIX00977.1 MAG: protein TolQ [Hydrogenophilales bacterium CG_4_8_14_3_um_filter_62_83]PIY98969.1 MA